MLSTLGSRASLQSARPTALPVHGGQQGPGGACKPQQHTGISAESAAAEPAFGRRAALMGVAGLILSMNAVPSAAAKPPSVIARDPGGLGGRDVLTTTTGLKFSEPRRGSGSPAKTGDLVLVDVVGRLGPEDNAKVFLDTRAGGTPLAFQVGTSNKYIPDGLSQVVEGMTSGSVRLAVLPASLGYGSKGVTLQSGRVPPNSVLYYEVELLRCETFSLGLACCTEEVFNKHEGSCVKEKNAAAELAASTPAV